MVRRKTMSRKVGYALAGTLFIGLLGARPVAAADPPTKSTATSKFAHLPPPPAKDDRPAVERAPAPAAMATTRPRTPTTKSRPQRTRSAPKRATPPRRPASHAKAPPPLPGSRWVKHTILPGERLDAIAERYGVTRDALILWNKLDRRNPRIYAGRTLRVRAEEHPPARTKIHYTVRRGDTWSAIARRHGVHEDDLRRWNRAVPRRFRAGTDLRLWVEQAKTSPDPKMPTIADVVGPELEPPPPPEEPHERDRARGNGRSKSKSKSKSVKLPAVTGRGSSVGKPNRGKLSRGVQMPEDAHWILRRPDEAYGSRHTVQQLLGAFEVFFEESGYDRPLSIGSLSKKGGGKLRPHKSHQSGRDADIRLPLAEGLSVKTIPSEASKVDWDATWVLIRALLETDQIEYVFLSHARQKKLYKAARRAGVSKKQLETWLQYPNPAGTNHGIVRHAKGHTAHIHVRFKCGPRENRCE